MPAADLSVRQRLAQLAQGMQQDAGDYARLQDLLGAQFHAALRHDAVAMADVAQRIAAQAQCLEQRSRVRVQHAQALLPAGTALSMTAVFAQLPESLRQQLMTLWGHLQTQVADCKTLNMRNCQLIMAQADTMRAVIAGGVPAEDIYGPR